MFHPIALLPPKGLIIFTLTWCIDGNSSIVPVILNQETLAEMIETTRSRVLMNKFRELGFIDYNGKIDVLSNFSWQPAVTVL
jgi:CRP/FNR family transcriptional regulator, cyclic AMP receptor protein